MIEFIIWVVGLILCIKAVIDIWKLNGDFAKKLLFIILILITSWVGLIVYYFFAKNKIADWVK